MFCKQTQMARRGFTLVELLVVIAIIGILIALLLPAVQAAREAARRTQCLNNLKQLGLAMHQYLDQNKCFPPGHGDFQRNDYSWTTVVLPYLEQQALYDKYDFTKRWNHSVNKQVKETSLTVQLCPSSMHQDPGQGDYGGIYGRRGATGLPGGWAPGQSYESGVLIATGGTGAAKPNVPKAPASIRDGLSNTLLVAEDAGRTDPGRFWVDGYNCYSPEGPLNLSRQDEIFSDHPGGAQVLFADSRSIFLSEGVALSVIDAVSTRSRGEVVEIP